MTLAVGTGVVLGACFIIADYINAKMTVKELQTELHDCQRRLYDIEHPAAARRFRDQEPETIAAGWPFFWLQTADGDFRP